MLKKLSFCLVQTSLKVLNLVKLLPMWRSFWKSAFRQLYRNKLYSTINVIGLAAGITCVLLAVLYWNDEYSFDAFHKNTPNLYRVTSSYLNEQGSRHMTGNTGHVHGPAFKAGTPEVKHMVRVLGGSIGSTLLYRDKTIKVQPLWVDSSFFDVFSFPLVRGNARTALKDINSVVLTETLAKKLFNSTDVIGKVLSQEADPSFKRLAKPLQVTAVVKDPPGNSSLQFDALFTFSFMELSFENDNWFGAWLGTFVVLNPGAKLPSVKDRFNAIYTEHAKSQVNNPEYNANNFDPKGEFGLQAMKDIHFNSNLAVSGWNEGAVVNVTSPVYSYAFMGIALFILAMAAINFINLSIASSLKRAKEVGIRKITGGSGRQIILQFLVESAILCLLSFLSALAAMGLLLPLFNDIAGKRITWSEILDTQLLSYFLLLFLVIIFLTGLYPAIVLSRFEAAKVLYNKQRLSGRNTFGRSLVVLQFTLAIFLIAATIVYYSQMDFIRTKNLGYNPSNIITTSVEGDRGDYKPIINYLKNELTKESSISSVAFGNHEGSEETLVNDRKFTAVNKSADENYLSVMEIPLVRGRNLSGNDKAGVIVNEAFVRAARLKQPIGERIFSVWFHDTTYNTIVGVFRDYHFASLREPIRPMIIRMPSRPEQAYVLWIKFQKENQPKAIASLEKIYKQIMPTALFEYRFVDEKNAAEYLSEKRWQKVINFASVLAFVLCSLGLFGLAHLSTHQRIKEIGVRKVLGASPGQIMLLFTSGFLKLVLIAVCISIPLSLVAINKWLENFAYRVEIGWWMFGLAGLVAVLISFLTVSTQAVQAAIANPVNSLRSD
jgi:putative ABC transport system permease protein